MGWPLATRGEGAGALIVPGGIAKGAGVETLFTVESGGCCATGADNGLGVAP